MEILIFFLLFSPFIIYAVFSDLKPNKKEPTTLNVYLKEPEDNLAGLSEKELMQRIRLQAMKDAALGDKSARDWVTKNITNNTFSNNKVMTDQTIIKEATATLKSLGYTAADAKNKVMSFASSKKYPSTEKLLEDCIRR